MAPGVEAEAQDVDVVIVSYRSREVLRATVEPLVGQADISLFVVDNASDDDSLASIADLPLTRIQLEDNRGFAAGCNCGWRRGSSPFVLFLNPDAHIEASSVRRLAADLARNPRGGIVGPLIRGSSGDLEYSQRRFPRIASAFAQALFLHRVLPGQSWVDELIRDPDAYGSRHSVDWISGACLMIRRDLLERLAGWDERFFMYCEDVDLCKRARDIGHDVVFQPAAVAHHAGGASAPRAELLPVLAASKALYAAKHEPPRRAAAQRVGLVLGSVTHAIVAARRPPVRRGHLRAVAALVSIR